MDSVDNPELNGGVSMLQRGISPFLSNHKVAYCLTIAAVLVIFAGFASGMTVGLMAIDPIQVKVLQEEGTQSERKR